VRRLPVYLLLDTSGSMRGEPIESVKVGLGALVSSLRQDPFALESVHLCLITFDREAKVIAPLEGIESFQVPEIVTPQSGPTHLGAALEMVCQQVDADVRKSSADTKGDWRPLLFVMTDGSPSDLQTYHEAVKAVRNKGFGLVVACAAGAQAKEEYLRELTDQVVSLDTADAASFSQFFRWVSASISVGNMSMGAAAGVTLPPPPPEIHHVVV
jgi:uncharacterized protein YegL